MELSMQMAVIFVGKQFAMGIVEYYVPIIKKCFNSIKVNSVPSFAFHCST